MFIEDGTGNAYKVKISAENCLQTFGTQVSFFSHVNSFHQQSYSVNFNQTPAAASDIFLYLKNTSDDLLILRSLSFYCTSAEGIEVRLHTSGTFSGSSSLAPVNTNTGSNNSADCICEVGDTIAGLTLGNTIATVFHNGTDSTVNFHMNGSVILASNTTLSLNVVNGLIQVRGMIDFAFHPKF